MEHDNKVNALKLCKLILCLRVANECSLDHWIWTLRTVKDKRFCKTFYAYGMKWNGYVASRRMHKLVINHKTWKVFSEKCTYRNGNRVFFPLRLWKPSSLCYRRWIFRLYSQTLEKCFLLTKLNFQMKWTPRIERI